MTFPIVVLGSLNMDLVVRASRAPQAGETLEARELLTTPGGKGANQAVACARQGARTAMVGCVGDDAFGGALRETLRADGIDVARVRTVEGSSGVAVVVVDDAAENRILIVPGANARVDENDARLAVDALGPQSLLLLQLEVPMPVVAVAARAARARSSRVVLNPAPVRPLPDALWSCVDYLVVNETEAAVLGGRPVDGIDAAARAARALRERGPEVAIVTLGAQGAVIGDAAGCRHFAAPGVRAVDTTAAGDTFTGAFAAAIAEGAATDAAIGRAIRAAALCVTRVGAQISIPTRRDVDAFAVACAPPRSL